MRMMNRKYLCIPIGVWAAMVFVSLLLYLYPQTDIAVSRLFYTPGEGFLQHKTVWERFFYRSVPVVLIALYSGALLLWLSNRLMHRSLLGFDGRKLLYTVLVAALGSGLLVNVVLKGNWGRARPVQIEAFGGDRHFTPPFVLSDQRGRSFSSGHTSGAFALLALVFLAPARAARHLSGRPAGPRALSGPRRQPLGHAPLPRLPARTAGQPFALGETAAWTCIPA